MVQQRALPDSGLQSISGEGEFLLSGSTLILGLLWFIDTPDQTRLEQLSTTFPPKILHAGWIALGSGLTGQAGSTLSYADLQVSWWDWFDFAARKIIFDSTSDPNTDRIIWKMERANTGQFQAFW